MQNSVLDLAIQIKNAYMASKDIIIVPYSRFREAVLVKLKELGYIESFGIEGDLMKKFVIHLAYNGSSAAITDIKVMSKPGRRFYVSYTELKPVIGGLGVSILSTSKGIMTNKEARKAKIGGELLFAIW